MDSNKLLPIEPKQSRSKKKFENILNSAEEILIQDKNVLTFISLSIHSKYKRASIYKYFPSTESLYIGILTRHLDKFSKLLNNNFKDKTDLNLEWYLKIYIDLLAIYLDKNKHLVEVFNLCDGMNLKQITLNKNSFIETLISSLKNLEIKHSEEKVRLATLLAMTILIDNLDVNLSIRPRTIAEAKKACLAYLNTP